MAKVRKKAGQALQKCKTPRLSRPWMQAFVDDALKTADLPAAMGRAKIGWGDYVRGRREDPAFDLACHELDQVVRHALLIQLECRAASGDFKSAKLLAGQLRAMAEQLRGQGVDSDFHASKSHPMVRIGDELVPVGPCSCCLAGLVVLIPWLNGHDHEILVRHDDARYFDVPPPIGWEDAKQLFGIAPNPGKLITNPEGSSLEIEGD